MKINRNLFCISLGLHYLCTMYKLKRMIVWMRRMRHSRGFGVQSPYDYRFIRYVINEHWPYYAYDELKESVTDIDTKTRKLCRLYFRLANWRQPRYIVDYRPEMDAYMKYMQAGCKRASLDRSEGGEERTLELGRMSLTGDYEAFYEQLTQRVDAQSVLVMERIKRDKETKAFWERVKRDERTGVTFDLYYCGIVFFNKKRFKQNYDVNF